MALRLRPGIPGLTSSKALLLQVGACALIAWAWFSRDPDTVRQPQAAEEPAASVTAAAVDTAGAPPAPEIESSEPVRPEAGETAHNALMGASTIEVIVRRNDTLDRIFRRLELNLADLASLRALPELKTRLDRLYPGESLRLVHRDGMLFGLERRLSPSETLKVVREESGFFADVLENPLEVRVRTIRGVIESSLFEAVIAAGAHDQTAMALAEIFGWDIDFVLDIRPGDSFVVTYEELLQDGEYVKDGPVLAASFVNQGREYRAVRYTDPSGVSGYYTPEGLSVRKAFLRAPLEFTRVSSRFNLKRRHPVLNRIRAHKGVDYAAPTGTPIRAAGDGRISFAGARGGYGNAIIIEHANGITTLYAHMSRFAKGMRPGRRVTQGTVIGYVGQSGLATGPHLHYEYRVNGVHKNPQTVELPDASPIDPRWREDFLARSAEVLSTLEAPLAFALVAR